MAKLTKPDMSIQWAQTGTIVVPSDGKKQLGWTAEKPGFENMNWLQNRQDSGLSYSFQMGITEWDNATEYQYASGYASYVQYNGIVYKAIQTGTNKNPSTETGYWTRAFDDYGAASTVNSALTSHITNYGTLAGLSNITTARSNLSVYSIAQCDAAFAPIAGNSSQTFLVGTATSAGHAVRKSQFDAKTGQADETTAGIAEVATQAETNAGASDATIITPLKLATNLVAKTASISDAKTGTSTTLFMTPSAFKGAFNDTGQQSLTTNGYQKLPGGMIIQWGIYDKGSNFTDGEQTTINLPVTFPTACLVVTPTLYNVANQAECEMIISLRTMSASSFVFHADKVVVGSNGRAITWFAIGY